MYFALQIHRQQVSNNSTNTNTNISANTISTNTNTNATRKSNGYLRSLQTLKENKDKYVVDHQWEKYLSKNRRRKFNPNGQANSPLHCSIDPETIFDALLSEQCYIFDSFHDECKLKYDDYITFLTDSYPSCTFAEQLEDRNVCSKQVVANIVTSTMICFGKKQDNLIPVDTDNIVSVVSRKMRKFHRGNINDRDRYKLAFRRKLCQVRACMNGMVSIFGNGLYNKDKNVTLLSKNDSMLNFFIDLKIRNKEKFATAEKLSQLTQENEQLQNENKSYKSDISNRTECCGSYKYEFAVVVNQMASLAMVPESRLAPVIKLAHSFLPVSLHINGMLPQIPCANTIAMQRAVMKNMMIDDIFDNGKNHGIAIGIDASTVASKSAAKMMPFEVTTKYVSPTLDEDYTVNFILDVLTPPRKDKENGQTSSIEIIGTFDTFPPNSVIAFFKSDTAKSELTTAKNVRLQLYNQCQHVHTRLMVCLQDGPHIVNRVYAQSMAVIYGMTTDSFGKEVDCLSNVCKKLYRAVTMNKVVMRKVLRYYRPDMYLTFNAVSITRFMGGGDACEQLYFSRWITPQRYNEINSNNNSQVHSNKSNSKCKSKRKHPQSKSTHTSTDNTPAFFATTNAISSTTVGHAREIGISQTSRHIHHQQTRRLGQNPRLTISLRNEIEYKHELLQQYSTGLVPINCTNLSKLKRFLTNKTDPKYLIGNTININTGKIIESNDRTEVEDDDIDVNRNEDDEKAETLSDDDVLIGIDGPSTKGLADTQIMIDNSHKNNSNSNCSNNNNSNSSSNDNNHTSSTNIVDLNETIARIEDDQLFLAAINNIAVDNDDEKLCNENENKETDYNPKYPTGLTREDGKIRLYDWKKIRVYLIALSEYQNDTKGARDTNIDEILTFFKDLPHLVLQFIGKSHREIGLIQLLDFFNSNKSAGRSIEMFTKIFESFDAIKGVKAVLLRSKIEKIDKEQFEEAVKIIEQRFDYSFMHKERCYLNVQGNDGSWKRCRHFPTRKGILCKYHERKVDENSNVIFLLNRLPPTIDKFQNKLYLWNKLQPKCSEFEHYKAFDDSPLTKDILKCIFWIQAYKSIEWQFYKFVQKWTPYFVPPIAVVACICDPNHGKEYAKKFVEIGKEKLLELSIECLNFNDEKKLEEYLNNQDKYHLHKSSMIWAENDVWKLICTWVESDTSMLNENENNLKYWKHNKIIQSHIKIDKSNNQLWNLIYPVASLIGNTLKIEGMQKIVKKLPNDYYKYKKALIRHIFWNVNHRDALHLGSSEYVERSQNGTIKVNLNNLATKESNGNKSQNIFNYCNIDKYHRYRRDYQHKTGKNYEKTQMFKDKRLCQNEEIDNHCDTIVLNCIDGIIPPDDVTDESDVGDTDSESEEQHRQQQMKSIREHRRNNTKSNIAQPKKNDQLNWRTINRKLNEIVDSNDNQTDIDHKRDQLICQARRQFNQQRRLKKNQIQFDHNKNEPPSKRRRLNKNNKANNGNSNTNDVVDGGDKDDTSGDDTSDNGGMNDTTTDTDLAISEFEPEIDIDQGLWEIPNTNETISLTKLAHTTVEGLGFKDAEMIGYLKIIKKWPIYRSDRLNKSVKRPQLINYLRENISKLKSAQG